MVNSHRSGFSASSCFAELASDAAQGDRACTGAKPFREVAQDEIRMIPELSRMRDSPRGNRGWMNPDPDTLTSGAPRWGLGTDANAPPDQFRAAERFPIPAALICRSFAARHPDSCIRHRMHAH